MTILSVTSATPLQPVRHFSSVSEYVVSNAVLGKVEEQNSQIWLRNLHDNLNKIEEDNRQTNLG